MQALSVMNGNVHVATHTREVNIIEYIINHINRRNNENKLHRVSKKIYKKTLQ